MHRQPTLDDDEALDILHTARVEPVGVLTQASNITLLVDLELGEPARGEPGSGDPERAFRAVYKPVRGERPLRDFPTGTLAAREVAAYLVSRAGGFDLVPPTVLRDGPLGPGSVQWWVDQEPQRLADPSGGLVEILAPTELGDGWLAVLSGEGEDGRPVVVAHADDPRLRSMAVLDVLLNNADRKAAHLTLDPTGALRGFDHGLCLHTDGKLRTVLWGWAGEPLTQEEAGCVALVTTGVAEGADLAQALAGLLSHEEVLALRTRAQGLLDTGSLPLPPGDRYPLPWPLW